MQLVESSVTAVPRVLGTSDQFHGRRVRGDTGGGAQAGFAYGQFLTGRGYWSTAQGLGTPEVQYSWSPTPWSVVGAWE